jgi:hypothetical protein
VTKRSLPVSEVLDDAADLVARVFAPWVGVLWIAAIPVRLLQVHFAGRLIEMAPEARAYGNHLHGIALATMGAFVLSVVGRMAYVRACVWALRAQGVPGPEAIRGPLSSLFTYLYAALLIEVLFFATAPSLIAIPAFILVAGLAAATSTLTTQAGLLAPFRAIVRHGGAGKVLLALLVLFAIALLLCMLNLYFAFQIGLWLLQGVPGLDLTAWQVRLALANPGFWLVLAAGGCLLVEPYWLASLVVYVHKVQSRQSGEDLRLRFDSLRAEEKAA